MIYRDVVLVVLKTRRFSDGKYRELSEMGMGESWMSIENSNKLQLSELLFEILCDKVFSQPL